MDFSQKTCDGNRDINEMMSLAPSQTHHRAPQMMVNICVAFIIHILFIQPNSPLHKQALCSSLESLRLQERPNLLKYYGVKCLNAPNCVTQCK